jgi:hypothetical protein
MNIPTFIYIQFVNKEGYLTDPMQLFMDELNQALQNGLSDNGWTLPQITAANLATISPKMPDGTMWYETDNNEFVVKISGALRKVTTAAYP